MSTAAPAREPTDRAAASAALPAAARARIARPPPGLGANPDPRVRYAPLARAGLEPAPRPRLKLSWLWRQRRSVGTLHFHWPEAYYRYGSRRRDAWRSWPLLGLFAFRLAAAKALGYRIAWTIHQVRPHESGSPLLDRLGTGVLVRAADTLIAHDGATAQEAREAFGRHASALVVIPHGSYVGVYPPGRSREAVRAELRIDADSFTFLCFGDLRAYKSVELLLDALAEADLPEATLVLAGGSASEELAQLVHEAERDPRVRARLGFVPETQVAELFGACDAAVLPRGDGGTSGSLILALSLGVPVVAARTRSYVELMDGEASGWLFTPDDRQSLRAALETAAASRDDAARRGANALRQAEELAWPEIGERTARALGAAP